MGQPRGTLNEPEICYLPPQKMAAVYAQGNPEQVILETLPALFNTLLTLKFEKRVTSDIPLPLQGLRIRYIEATGKTSPEWTLVMGLPVPEETTALPQMVGGIAVRLETWEYGTIAQISHDSSIIEGLTPHERLVQFIITSGRRVIGVREEEFHAGVTGEPVTIIRYRIAPA